jgi:hypothetical protein
VIASGIVLLALARLSSGGQKSVAPPPSKSAQAATAGWTMWKSETTGKEYRVRIEKDRFSAEWANIPPAAAKQGSYIRTECRRAGTKWIGTSQVYLPCANPGIVKGKVANACHLTLRFEVDSVSRDRITGGAEVLRDFDCGKCEVRKTSWGSFVWVPKR